MNKQLNALLALVVACATATTYAQASTPGQTQPLQDGQGSSPKTANGTTSVQAKIAMCVGCHNIPGYQASFPEVYRVPKIAGQNAKYIASALTAYKKGDRKHPTMRGIADSLSDQDINEIAAYYSALGKQAGTSVPPDQPNETPDAQVSGLLQKAACVSCHGSNFSKPIDPSYPKIAGQHADYLFVALRAYKTENNANFGRNNGVMGAIVKQFSNAELKALAGYVSSLDGEVKTVPESKFR